MMSWAHSVLVRCRHRAYLLLLGSASLLPLGWAYGIARWLGRVRFGRLPRALWLNEDVREALGVSREQMGEWGRRASELRESEALEAHLYRRLDRGTLGRLIRIEGLDHLEAALEAGRGAILFSGHVPSRFTFFAALAELGHPPTLVGYPPELGPSGAALPIDLELRKQRAQLLEQKFGCRFLWMQPGNPGVAVKAANALRRNGVVGMLVDLSHHNTSVNVPLLAGRTRFAVGPALVAQATGAPMLDFFIHRDDGWVPQIAEIGPPFAVGENPEGAVRECAARLDAHIRRHPPPPWKFFSTYPWDITTRG